MNIINKLFVKILIFSLCFFSFSCMSLSVYETDLFVGKKETALINSFRNDGISYYSSEYMPWELGFDNSYCDKILYLTNIRDEYTFSKTTVTTYKKTKQTTIYNLSFIEYPDGCCLSNGLHYAYHIDAEGIGYATHNRGNSYNSLTSFFYNFIKKYDCYHFNDNQYAFDNHQIGDIYYLYSISSSSGYVPGAFDGTYPSESYTMYSFYIYKIELIAEERSNTEIHKTYYFQDVKKYLDENGYEISQQEFNNLKSYYMQDNYSIKDVILGAQKIGFIKDGKIIAIGHFDENKTVVIDSESNEN